MKTVSAAEMRELDRRTIENGTPGEELMLRAGQGVADIARDVLTAHNGKSILLIAGTGNNGGDVFAAATDLAASDFDIEVWLCGSRSQVKGDAETHLKKMVRAGIVPKEVHSENDLCPKMPPDILIDGLLGTGSHGAPRGFMSPLIDWINREQQSAFILSIDIPSGIDADTGVAEGSAVQADMTATIGLPKTGLIRPEALPMVGNVEVIDIGIPLEFVEDTTGCPEAALIDRSDIFIPRRPRDSHKGSYGHVLLIGGSTGYTGAIAMAARAALRSGAGLVSVLTPESVYPIVAQAAGPEAMVHPFSSLGKIPEQLSNPWKNADAVLIGPGLGRSDEARTAVEWLLSHLTVPLVLDADALCVAPETIAAAACPVVLTPHPGEFERLFGAPVTNRWRQAREAAGITRQTVVLKGAGTIVAVHGHPLAVNLTGNPGMAAGGSGDVLAGLLTGLLGQDAKPFDAAMTAVYLHGLAGDIAAEIRTQQAMLPTDLIDALPDAFRFLKVR
ncbi:MAG: NAD(P)H-hydrate dehydratase [Pontiellaceae bacterium]|jgi:NAD(P)H-hydrate epimerase|nr:NAD(P)H-hydrate dehydratase [Pontiellaceae bacterium]